MSICVVEQLLLRCLQARHRKSRMLDARGVRCDFSAGYQLGFCLRLARGRGEAAIWVEKEMAAARLREVSHPPDAGRGPFLHLHLNKLLLLLLREP